MKDEQCSIARPVALLGDRWTLILLRQAFTGVRRFDQFQATMGLSRAVLAQRLPQLVDAGIFERTAYKDEHRTRYEYRLTDKGMDLLPTMIALRQWGEKWETGTPSNPVLVDKRDMLPVAEMCVHAADGRPLEWEDLCFRWQEELAQVRAAE